MGFRVQRLHQTVRIHPRLFMLLHYRRHTWLAENFIEAYEVIGEEAIDAVLDEFSHHSLRVHGIGQDSQAEPVSFLDKGGRDPYPVRMD